MDNYVGVIIEESLERKDILKKVEIMETITEKVTPEHDTPYLRKWTVHTVRVYEDRADDVAEELSKSLDSEHGDWYADFKNSRFHFIVFRNRIFKIDRRRPEQYSKVVEYGLRLGIPEHQLDFTPDVKQEGDSLSN